MSEFKSYRSYFDFSSAVRNRYRYVYDKPTYDFIQAVQHTCEKYSTDIKEGSILFRAQRGCDTRPVHEQETGEYIADDDWPYKKERMLPLKNKSYEGRANPRGITYLYLASNKDTDCAEVRPWKGSIISLGVFHVKKNLKIIDCSKFNKTIRIYFEEPDPSKREECVWCNINSAFSRPVNPNDPETEYVPTQIIAEIIREKGYDGIAYKSSFEEGYNIVLFDSDAVEIIGCWLTETKDIKFEFNHSKSGYGKNII